MRRPPRTFAASFSLLASFAAATLHADLRDYAPANATVTTSSAALLAADGQMRTVQLTNTGGYPIWYCHSGQTAVATKGFYLPAGATVTLDGEQIPSQGLSAIAVGGSTVIAIGKG